MRVRKRYGLRAAWKRMHDRCYNPLNKAYHRYGGRGITVADAWGSFDRFRRDMEGTYEPGLSLDRIDNNKGYSVDNCQWLTVSEHARKTWDKDIPNRRAEVYRRPPRYY